MIKTVNNDRELKTSILRLRLKSYKSQGQDQDQEPEHKTYTKIKDTFT